MAEPDVKINGSSGRRIKMLVVAGGGVRGMIPCTLLAATSPEDIAKIDVFGGTSVGGVIALHLAMHGDGEAARSAFREHVEDIFSRSLVNFVWPWSPKYSGDSADAAFQDIFGCRVSDVPGKFVVPSLNFKEVRPVIFQNFDSSYSHFEVWKIARATTAAPMYFPPFSENILVDGGILENLPVITTASMACKHLGLIPAQIDVFALGTGRYDEDLSRTLSAVSSYSKLDWAKDLMPVLTTGGNQMMSRLWGENMGFHSFRMFDPITVDGAMDDVTMVPSIEEKCELYTGRFLKEWKEFLHE